MKPARTRSSRALRVLIVGTHLSKHGGHRTPSEDLQDRLRQAGGLEVIACSDRKHGVSRLADTTATILRHWRRLDVAIIDVFSGRAFLLAEWARGWAARAGARTVLTLHGGGLPDFAETSGARVQRLLLEADHVTSPSTYLAKSFGHVREVDVIPNPIDRARFFPETVARAPHTSGDSPHLVWVRAFHAIYRPWDAVEVLHRVAQSHESARLTLVGADKDDGSLQRVRDSARRLGLEARVRVVLGIPHRDIPGVLRAADVFLNTTTVDNTPLSVLEALAVGVPVVTTDVGGIPHLLENGRSALLSPVADIDSMAEQVLRLLAEPSLADRLRTGGLAVAADHDWAEVLPRWQALIQEAVESR